MTSRHPGYLQSGSATQLQVGMDHVATHVGLYSMSGLGHAGTETVRRSLKITDEKRRPVGFFNLQTNQSPPTRMRWSSQAVDVLHADMQSSSHHTHTQRRSKAKFFTEPARNNCRQAKKRESRRAGKNPPRRTQSQRWAPIPQARLRPSAPTLPLSVQPPYDGLPRPALCNPSSRRVARWPFLSWRLPAGCSSPMGFFRTLRP